MKKKTIKLASVPSYNITDDCGKTFRVDFVKSTGKWHCNGSTTFYGFTYEEIENHIYSNVE